MCVVLGAWARAMFAGPTMSAVGTHHFVIVEMKNARGISIRETSFNRQFDGIKFNKKLMQIPADEETHQTWFRHIRRSNCFQRQWRRTSIWLWWVMPASNRIMDGRREILFQKKKKRATRFGKRVRCDTHAKHTRNWREARFSFRFFSFRKNNIVPRRWYIIRWGCMLRAMPCQTCTIHHCVAMNTQRATNKR